MSSLAVLSVMQHFALDQGSAAKRRGAVEFSEPDTELFLAEAAQNVSYMLLEAFLCAEGLTGRSRRSLRSTAMGVPLALLITDFANGPRVAHLAFAEFNGLHLSVAFLHESVAFARSARVIVVPCAVVDDEMLMGTSLHVPRRRRPVRPR